MYGRMIHRQDGSTYPVPYGVKDQVIKVNQQFHFVETEQCNRFKSFFLLRPFNSRQCIRYQET